jgi:hypothetical protein
VNYGDALKTVILGPRFPDWQPDGGVALGNAKGFEVCQGLWDGFGLRPDALTPHPSLTVFCRRPVRFGCEGRHPRMRCAGCEPGWV